MGRPVTQFQILSKDPERAERFYAELFGWTIASDNPLGYRQIDTGSKRGIQGGIWPAPPEAPSFVQLFVEVDDVASHCARVETLGGRVVIRPQRLPQGETLAIVTDAEGVPFGLVQPPSPAKRP